MSHIKVPAEGKKNHSGPSRSQQSDYPLHRGRRHRRGHHARHDRRDRRGGCQGLWWREKNPLDGSVCRRESHQSVRRQRLAAARNLGHTERVFRIHQRPDDHARGRRHPLAQRRAAPRTRPLPMRAPVRYFNGVPSPLKDPSKTDMVIFRENTEEHFTPASNGKPKAKTAKKSSTSCKTKWA